MTSPKEKLLILQQHSSNLLLLLDQTKSDYQRYLDCLNAFIRLEDEIRNTKIAIRFGKDRLTQEALD